MEAKQKGKELEAGLKRAAWLQQAILKSALEGKLKK